MSQYELIQQTCQLLYFHSCLFFVTVNSDPDYLQQQHWCLHQNSSMNITCLQQMATWSHSIVHESEYEPGEVCVQTEGCDRVFQYMVVHNGQFILLYLIYAVPYDAPWHTPPQIFYYTSWWCRPQQLSLVSLAASHFLPHISGLSLFCLNWLKGCTISSDAFSHFWHYAAY